MPAVPDPPHGRPGRRNLLLLTAADLEQLTRRAGLAPAQRLRIRAAAAVAGFSITSYAADELIDWQAVPDDPVWRLFFPDADMLPGEVITGIAGLVSAGAPGARIRAAAAQARPPRAAAHRLGPGEPVLPGVHRSYHDTVAVCLPPGPRGRRSYGMPGPGTTWPGLSRDPAMAAADLPRLTGYLRARPEVSIVQFTGTDPLITSPAVLRRYLEPLLAAEHVACIQLDTTALAYWPHRLLAGPGADDTLRLFEQVRASGKTIMLIAGFRHPRELAPPAVSAAARRVAGTGAVTCARSPVAGTVNDTQSTWTDMWRAQIRMGIVPRTMTIQHITGPARHYQVPLARAQQIFARAYASVSGLARTVRGPAMHDEHGFLSIDGTTQVGAEKMFMLRYLQARDPQIAARPFFAAFDPAATWLTDLHPVPSASSGTPAGREDRQAQPRREQ